MEYLFCDLPSIAENKENIADGCYENKWRKIDYKTKMGKGIMLVAAQDAYPEKIKLNINLKGWFRIYVCLVKMRSESYTYIKLSDDICYTGLRTAKSLVPAKWCTTEYVEEVYWKCSDLTNQQVYLARPKANFMCTSGLVWIRCEKMTEAEIKEYKDNMPKNRCVQMHFDEDSYAEDSFKCIDDYLIRLNMLEDSNTDFCSFEYSFDYDRAEVPHNMPILKHDKKWREGDIGFDAVKEEVYKKCLDFAHKQNIPLYAANRMSIANFSAPYSRESWNKKFVKENTQYYCKNRDGSIANVCSYAYDEVQQYAISNMLEMIQKGFDGISMIFHRGMYIGFDKPVIERFKCKYPDINPCTLPACDERLNGIWSDFMTEFMRRIRNSLDRYSDKRIPINVIADYGLESSKNFGVDVERWAKEKLIDSASQGDMETYEDLTDCMCDGNPDIIDMDKYSKRILDYPIIRRFFGTDPEYVCSRMNEYIKLEKEYGIKVYHVLPWVHSVDINDYEDIVTKMKENGAKRFLCWNTNHLAWDLPEWHIVSHIGNKRNKNIDIRKYYRVLSIDNSDISHFNPNWRG